MKKRLAQFLFSILAKYATEYTPDRTYIHGGLQPARLDLSQTTRDELCRLAINMEHRNWVMGRLLDIWECYTVGAGLQISPASSDPEWNKRAKDWQQTWEQYPDINSRQSFGTLASLVSRTWANQGECFVVFTNEPDKQAFPRLQLVEGRLCHTPPDRKEMEGISVIDGIQVDGNQRPIGYYFADEDSGGRKTFGAPKPARNVHHIFEPSRPGQFRGVTMWHAVINELRDLWDLMLLEMIAAKDGAEKSNIVTTETGELNVQTLMRARAGITQQGITTGSVDNTENRAAHVQAMLGGRTISLRKGEEFAQFRNERPGAASQAYWRYLTEAVCNGFGIPYCMAFPPEQAQGTVYRGALDLAATFFNQRFIVIADFCKRVYIRNMQWARTNDRRLVDAPADWFKCTVHAPRACNVDVGYNSAATIAEIGAGLTTPAIHYGARGMDWKEQFDSLNEQLKYADTIGLLDRLAKINASQKALAEPTGNTPDSTEVPIKQAA